MSLLITITTISDNYTSLLLLNCISLLLFNCIAHIYTQAFISSQFGDQTSLNQSPCTVPNVESECLMMAYSKMHHVSPITCYQCSQYLCTKSYQHMCKPCYPSSRQQAVQQDDIALKDLLPLQLCHCKSLGHRYKTNPQVMMVYVKYYCNLQVGSKCVNVSHHNHNSFINIVNYMSMLSHLHVRSISYVQVLTHFSVLSQLHTRYYKSHIVYGSSSLHSIFQRCCCFINGHHNLGHCWYKFIVIFMSSRSMYQVIVKVQSL